MTTIRVGSRDSKLAIVQSKLVIAAMRKACPAADIQLVTMKTTGDKILDRTLDQIGGKGLFVKELDRALLEGRVDVTVHSMKDLPIELDERLPIAAVSARAAPYDALVLPKDETEWDRSKPVGCASLRRTMQLRRLYPDVTVLPVRGNVQTRLSKLDSGQFGALILAQAGLARLGLEHRISHLFSPEEMIPAACQGILAVQTRRDFDPELLRFVQDEEAALCARAERVFLRRLDGGCTSPVAAFAQIHNNSMTIRGLYVSPDGGRIKTDTITCDPATGAEAASALAARLKGNE